MILYLLLIAFAILVISSVVAIATWTNFFVVLGMTALAALIVILIDALTATVCRLLPAKWVNPDKKIFQVSAKEKKGYEKLKIRKWKDVIPEIGQFTGFRKNKLIDPKSVEYLDRFLLESAYGEVGHFCSCWTSFLLLLLFPIYEYWLAISIPVAVVSMLLNIPSFMILRYNSYKLRVLKNSMLKKQRREADNLKIH